MMGTRTRFRRMRALLADYHAVAGDRVLFERYCRLFNSLNPISEVSLGGRWTRTLADRFGLTEDCLEKTLRQRLATRCFADEVMPQMIPATTTGTAMTLPFPQLWRDAARAQGMPVAEYRSRWAFAGLVCRAVLGGVRMLVRLLRHAPAAPARPYVAFPALPAAAAQEQTVDGKALHGFISWYRTSPLHDPEAEVLWVECADTPEYPADDVFVHGRLLPRLGLRTARVTYALRGFGAVLAAVGGLFLGRWQRVIMLGDILTLDYVRRLPAGALARRYIFNNTLSFSQPLWTHWAAANGIRIVLVFYSANMVPFRMKNSCPRWTFPGYRIMSWPEYVVWSAAQAEDLRLAMAQKGAAFDIVPRVDFIDSGAQPPAIPAGSVVVFDVTAQRPFSLASRGFMADYYDADTVISFLRQAHLAIRASGRTMILKRKRDIAPISDRRYLAFLRTLSQEPDVIEVDPGVSPTRLIPMAAAVVSIPFTSTGMIAGDHGIPSAYFDPTERLIFPAPMPGITTTSGVEELTQWLRQATATPQIRHESSFG